MSRLAALLGRLARAGLRLEAKGGQIAVTPASRLTPELRAEILHDREEVLEVLQAHGSALLELFRDPPPWPPARERTPGSAEHIWGLVGHSVRLPDGRGGLLRFAEYRTRTGRVRCWVDCPEGQFLVDPEDISGPASLSSRGSLRSVDMLCPNESIREDRGPPDGRGRLSEG